MLVPGLVDGVEAEEGSRPPARSATTTPSGARAAPNRAPGCYAAWSSAAPAAWAPAATRCAAATAPGTATTTATTTTRCAPGGQDHRGPERNIRADALDEFVFAQVRAALLNPALLLAGERAIAVHAPVPDDQLLAAELARLDRKLEAARSEHRRLIDLYQAGLIDMPELRRRAAAITARQHELEHKRTSLAAERADLARGNRLRRGVGHFAARVAAVIVQLDPAQRQELLRLLIEDVQVTGWHVKIRLRIPLDDAPDSDPAHHPTPSPRPAPASSKPPVSAEDRLRSLHADQGRLPPARRSTRRQGGDPPGNLTPPAGRTGGRQPGNLVAASLEKARPPARISASRDLRTMTEQP